MVREIQTLLLSHKHIHLRWLKDHVGYLGNECANQLAKEAITKRDPFLLPKSLSFLKSEIKSSALSIWTLNTSIASISEHMNTARAEKKEIQFNMPQNVGLPSPGISKLQQCHLNCSGCKTFSLTTYQEPDIDS
ncbi:hypothetical protein AVEN_260544-1 [Araneus ventricosus]|uniref:RNase H type-1 domain-containing protein n=1 Tax=Araneus ventricosus TaxID=182803 RepID=A0A4Y2I2Q3_ARAVE|nr:hypothetical protein AVEN_260544-1 [Araneus ventricosus]